MSGDKSETLALGDRVISSQLNPFQPMTGTVSGYGRDYPRTVRIIRDGLTKRGNLHQPETWAGRFWEKIDG